MNNKRKMTGADKRKYFLFRAKKDLGFYITIISFILALVFGVLYLLKVISITPLVIDLTVLLVSFIYFLFVDVLYVVIFMWKKEIVDGYVYKVHRGREYANNHEASYMASKAKAMSKDGKITTNWQYCSRRLHKEKKKPVYIILNKKGRGSEFYY